MILDLTQGITDTPQYNAWIFPGGEIHFKLKQTLQYGVIKSIDIVTRINNANDLLFLCLVIDTLRKERHTDITLFMPYMPYQQADRDFGKYECFSLKTVCNIINSYDLTQVTIFDAHSDVAPALLNNCVVKDNSEYIKGVIDELQIPLIVSPDAGAYKKIFKLAVKIGYKGDIECANKFRAPSGEITVKAPYLSDEQKTKPLLIIDDICLGGRTFIELAKLLNERGHTGPKYLAVSHGIFVNGLEELLQYYKLVYSTDSRIESLQKQSAFLHVTNIF